MLDGADTNSAPEIQGAVQQILGEYQSRSLETMIDDLPEEVFDLGRKLPEFRSQKFLLVDAAMGGQVKAPISAMRVEK